MNNKILSIIALALWVVAIYWLVPIAGIGTPAYNSTKFILGVSGIPVLVFVYRSFMPTVTRQSGVSTVNDNKFFPLVIVFGVVMGAIFHNVGVGIALAVSWYLIFFLYRLCVRHYSK